MKEARSAKVVLSAVVRLQRLRYSRSAVFASRVGAIMDPPQKTKPDSRPTSPSRDPRAEAPSGRVRHDDRGNAVWDWLKDTARNAIDSTSRLLRKLESPELEVEDKKDEELRIQSDRDPGGGYDPYNQSVRPGSKPLKPSSPPPRKGR